MIKQQAGLTAIPSQCHLWNKENLNDNDLDISNFKVIRKIKESSHFDRSILQCQDCGQLYFYEFKEVVDWVDGNDDMYSTYIPISHSFKANDINNKSAFELLDVSPQLRWDSIKGKSRIFWSGKNNE